MEERGALVIWLLNILNIHLHAQTPASYLRYFILTMVLLFCQAETMPDTQAANMTLNVKGIYYLDTGIGIGTGCCNIRHVLSKFCNWK